MSLPLPLYTPTRAFPNPLFPNLHLGGWFNQLTYKILPLLTAPYRGVVNQWREEVLKLPPRSWRVSEQVKENGQTVPVLYSYSAHVVPRPEDWSDQAIATGYWFLDSQEDWQPPADLVEFLAAGSAPFMLGLGVWQGVTPNRLPRW
jgi:sterol 3beta-glucosyltransferase